MTIEKPGLLQLRIEVDPAVMEAVRQLPRAKLKIEADFFMLMSRIGASNERPYFPYVILLVDATHNLVLGFEMLAPQPSLEQMWGQVGITALQQLAQIGARPSEIRIRDNLLYGMMLPFAKELNLKIKQVDHLPMLDMARRGLQSFLRR
jgi:hypothetical protein